MASKRPTRKPTKEIQARYAQVPESRAEWNPENEEDIELGAREQQAEYAQVGQISVEGDSLDQDDVKSSTEAFKPKQWPPEPQTPREARGSVSLFVAWDCVLLLLPLLFIALAITAYRLDKQPISAYGDRVRTATRLGPTMFPIVFAAIAKRCLVSLVGV
jgi:hypothetical protein